MTMIYKVLINCIIAVYMNIKLVIVSALVILVERKSGNKNTKILRFRKKSIYTIIDQIIA